MVARRLLKYWSGSRVEAEGRMARSEGGASPERAVTTERRCQLPFCLAPSTVALIFALAGGARWAEVRAGRAMAADIDAALAPWPTPKSTATRPTPVFQQSPRWVRTFCSFWNWLKGHRKI